jgi:putative tricarboxylic transport membrane protein
MIEKEKLRKADVFSGALISLFGLWIISQAFKMPMKDSWGGVMNVWYVSPALLPLSIGIVLTVLGLMLCRIGLKAIGLTEFKNTVRWLSSKRMVSFLTLDTTVRFYAIAVLFLTLVYVNLARIDFFLCAFLFLIAFITMFYFDDDAVLKRLLLFYIAGEVGFIIYFALHLGVFVDEFVPFGTDLLSLCFTLTYCLYAWRLVQQVHEHRRKFRISVMIGIVTPLIIGAIFKYFLMVPMPKEGLVVTFLDMVRYLDF